MSIINIGGKWTGIIRYGNSYGRSMRNQFLYFEATFERNGYTITGIAEDIEGRGFNPEPATVSGTLNDLEIEFTKQYLNVTEDGNLSKPEVFYRGVYNVDKDSFSGNWSFEKADPGSHQNITKYHGSGRRYREHKKDQLIGNTDVRGQMIKYGEQRHLRYYNRYSFHSVGFHANTCTKSLRTTNRLVEINR